MNQHKNFLLNRIAGPQDLKKLSLAEMNQLAAEIRTLIVEKDAAQGGHLGPDLGIVEATIAYHYVFNAPQDKIVWDVSHQTYPHKMLTGRAQAWLDPDCYTDVSPYSNPDESPYDDFAIGHTSTSIALATGMAKARDLRGGQENIMALIGDGSLTGGLAFEGLNNAAIEPHNLVIVVNDNQWSIDKNVGGVVTALQKLRDSNGQTPENPFQAMGFDYRYVADGNDLAAMIAAFQAVKDVDHPILLHINTLKGQGYEPAIQAEEAHHWVSPFNLANDNPLNPKPKTPNPNSVALEVIQSQIAAGQNIMAITAAIPGAFELDQFKKQYPDHYLDVGIAEQESITLAAGFARAGGTPILMEKSTFLQRAFDQLSHDVAANDLPVVMLVSGGNISDQSKTHLGVFDQVMLANLPNWRYLAPTTLAEEQAMLEWAINQKQHPVAIKMPQEVPLRDQQTVTTDYTTIHYHVQPGQKIAILALGDFYQLGQKIASQLQATLVNPLAANILDEATLTKLAEEHEIIVTLEDNILDGGFGQKVAAYLGPKKVKVLNYGQKRIYTDQTPLFESYAANHLTAKQIISDVQALEQSMTAHPASS